MPNKVNSAHESMEPAVYQIRIQGHLGCQWAEWFDGLAVVREDSGDTLLTGPVIDQAALYGVLRKIRDIGMPLLSLMCLELGRAEADPVELEQSSKTLANGEIENEDR